MAKMIYILSHRYGTDMSDPVVFLKKKEAQQEADRIMKEILQEAYFENTGKNTKLSLAKLKKWAEENGFGDSSYFWDGKCDATEIRITAHEIP